MRDRKWTESAMPMKTNRPSTIAAAIGVGAVNTRRQVRRAFALARTRVAYSTVIAKTSQTKMSVQRKTTLGISLCHPGMVSHANLTRGSAIVYATSASTKPIT